MENRHALMLGNRIVGISRLIKAGQTVAAQEQMERLHLNIEPVVLQQYAKVIESAQKYYQANDPEMLEVIGNGLIDRLLNKPET